MKLTTQKRLAAEIMKVGTNRVWIDPSRIEDVSKAITRDDVRYYISQGAIDAEPEKGISRGRFREKKTQQGKGRRKGHGRRSGTKMARNPRKASWIRKVRALREELRTLKEEDKLEDGTYRKAYRQIKGNLFNSRRHLRESLSVKKK